MDVEDRGGAPEARAIAAPPTTRAAASHGSRGGLATLVSAFGDYARLSLGQLPKLAVLARERLLLARTALAPAAGLPGIADLAPDTETTWTTDERYELPAALLDAAAISAQDVRAGPSTLLASVEHRVATLHGATVYANEYSHRTVFDRDGRVLPVLSSVRGGRGAPTRRPRPLRRVAGRTVSAYGNVAMAGGNFGHWMIDGIAMLLLARREHDLGGFDRVLVPPLMHDFHRDSLALFGFEGEAVLELPALEVLVFDELVCTSSPRGTASSIQPGWAVDGFRELVLGDAPPARTDRLVYVSRRDAKTRNFVNEAEVAALLESRGFETVELSAFDLAGKARLFAESRCVVALTGAGPINAMFAGAGALFLEIFPPTLVNYCVAAICDHVGCDYDFLVADDASALSRANRYYGDLHLDLDALGARLDAHGLA